MRGQEPAAVMHDLGFGRLLLLASFPVKMSGSGRSFTAYVFSKISPGAAAFMEQARMAGAAAAAQQQQRTVEDDGVAAAAAAGATGGDEEAAGVPRVAAGELASSSGQQLTGGTGTGSGEPQPAAAVLCGSGSTSSPSKQSSRPMPGEGGGGGRPVWAGCLAGWRMFGRAGRVHPPAYTVCLHRGISSQACTVRM